MFSDSTKRFAPFILFLLIAFAAAIGTIGTGCSQTAGPNESSADSTGTGDGSSSGSSGGDDYFVAGSAEGEPQAGGGTEVTLAASTCFALPTAVYAIGGYHHGDPVGAGRVHAGDDVTAPAGTEVRAIWEGTIRFAAKASTWGYLVEIDHIAPDGTPFISLYGHLDPNLSVAAGSYVPTGQVLGTTGTKAVNGGWSPHLHYSIFTGTHPASGVLQGHVVSLNGYEDPIPWMDAHGNCGTPAQCPNGQCSGGESCSTCPQDCGTCPPGCPDGQCSNGETCSSCPQDCGSCPPVCADGQCNGSENCSTCPQDCGGCPPGCPDGQCNGSETCSTCPQDCGACPPVCQDGQCNGSETCSSCPQDCGPCPCSYTSYSTAADYSCGGGVILSIAGSIDNNGNATISATKLDNSTFGAGDYYVFVFDPDDNVPGNHCKEFNVSKGHINSAGGQSKLTFQSFPSLLVCGGAHKGYCVTKSAGGDDAWFCSNEFYASYQ